MFGRGRLSYQDLFHYMSCSWRLYPKGLPISAFNIYERPFRVQHLAQGHLAMQMGKTGNQTADLLVGERLLYPASAGGFTGPAEHGSTHWLFSFFHYSRHIKSFSARLVPSIWLKHSDLRNFIPLSSFFKAPAVILSKTKRGDRTA